MFAYTSYFRLNDHPLSRDFDVNWSRKCNDKSYLTLPIIYVIKTSVLRHLYVYIYVKFPYIWPSFFVILT